MLLEKVLLKNFRNYEYQEIIPKKGINIVYGRNGQGKTNLLEAIFLCSTARSHRTSKDIDLIKNGQDFYYIEIEGKRDEEPFSISIHSNKKNSKNTKRTIKVNDINIKKIGELMGIFNCVMFSPEDLDIIKGGPAERRRFLDILISQINPPYFYNLQEYYRIVKQKNAYLKILSNSNQDPILLDVYNQKQAKVGFLINKERQAFVNLLSEDVKEINGQFTKDKEKLEIKYNSEQKELCESEEEFYEVLSNNKSKEIRNQSTIYGPHRDDLEILLNNYNIREYGSQGQQRTAVLSLKFSEINIIKNKTNKNPIILLDDALSELDLTRKRALLEKIENNQTFITCTEKRTYMTLSGDINFFNVNDGIIKGF